MAIRTANNQSMSAITALPSGVSAQSLILLSTFTSDGSGAYIKEWNLDIAKPSDDQLATYNSAATTEENNNVIRATRRKAYGNIGEQLDEIYKDIDAWKARIKSIKDANPKG